VEQAGGATLERGDWSLRTAKWVTRADDMGHTSPFEDIAPLASRTAATEAPADASDAPQDQKGVALAFALNCARCSINKEVDGQTQNATVKLAGKLRGKDNIKIEGTGADTKISYKDLQISIIKGPTALPEMSVSFPGPVEKMEEANALFVEFERILGNINDDGRRTLDLGDGITIGLPVKDPFTNGVRFRVLADRRVILDSDCMEALNGALNPGGADDAKDGDLGAIWKIFQPKYAAYTDYREKLGKDEAKDRSKEERKAAFTLDELDRLIKFLQQRLKMEISSPIVVINRPPMQTSDASTEPEPKKPIILQRVPSCDFDDKFDSDDFKIDF
jgi:hypothetical protein